MALETALIANMRNRGFHASRKTDVQEFGMSHNAEFMQQAMRNPNSNRGGYNGGRGGNRGGGGGNNYRGNNGGDYNARNNYSNY